MKFSPVFYWTFSLALLVFLIWLLRGMISPFLTGILIAYLLNPLVTKGQLFFKARWFSAGFILLSFFIFLTFSIIYPIPYLFEQIVHYAAIITNYFQNIEDQAFQKSDYILKILPNNAKEQFISFITANLEKFLSIGATSLEKVLSTGLSAINTISFILITPVVAFYLMRDWPFFIRKINILIPIKNKETVINVIKDIDETISAFIRGQALVALCLSFFYATSLIIIGLNFALLIGIIAGLLTIIPYVGAILGIAITLMITLIQFSGWTMPLIVISIFLIGHLIESYVLVPILIGNKIGLHPVWIIFALMAGQYLLGFTGVLIAVPVAAVIGVMIRFLMSKYQKSSAFKKLK